MRPRRNRLRNTQLRLRNARLRLRNDAQLQFRNALHSGPPFRNALLRSGPPSRKDRLSA